MLTETDNAGANDAAQTSPTTNGLQAGHFGDRSRELRKARGLSAPALAKLAGYSRNYIFDLSAGRRSPQRM
jgi:hypothetical protein